MLKTSITDNCYTARYGVKEGLERLKRHGLSGVDFQGFVDVRTPFFTQCDEDFDRECRSLRAIYDNAGVTVCQAHAPWSWPHVDDDAFRAVLYPQMEKAVRGTSLLGCDTFVIHPLFPFGADSAERADEVRAINADFLTRLADYAASLGVTVALENMPFTHHCLSRPSEVLSLVREIGHPHLKVCLDTGHAALCREERPGTAVRMIGGELLCAMHIHDNDGTRDLHLNPYHGVIDWEDFIAALREIGYDRWFSLETSAKSIPAPVREPAERALCDVINYVAARVTE